MQPRPLKWPPIFPLEKGLVMWLPFDERSGSKALDRSGKLNHGTLHGPSWVPGKRGSALSFDGITNYVPHGVNGFSRVEGTLLLWMKPGFDYDAPTYAIVWGGGVTDTDLLAFYYVYDIDKWCVYVYPANVLEGTVQTESFINTWIHVALTWKTGEMKLYLNNVLDGSGIVNLEGASQPATIWLGDQEYLAHYPYPGILDEVRIYNRALTAAEIKRHYESELMLTRW